MTTLTAASRNWATRPDDERFATLTALQEKVEHNRHYSRGQVVSSRSLHAVPVDAQQLVIRSRETGNDANPTHWAFGQLARLAGAPGAYLRGLPAPLAADCLNYGLQVERDAENTGVMVYKNGGPRELRAVTGPNYGRIWNADVAKALVSRFGDGINGRFRVPGEFGERVEITKANTTLFASDRDMFIFLADEDNRIEIANRRDGQPGSLARGFFIWNSEVGKCAFGISMFLFDYVCCNRIVWGAQDVRTLRVRHTAKAPDAWLGQVAPMIEAYADAGVAPLQAQLAAAQRQKVQDVEKFLTERFGLTLAQSDAVKAAHQADEGRPMETLWDVATGITARARAIGFQDDRIELERVAGQVLALAA